MPTINQLIKKPRKRYRKRNKVAGATAMSAAPRYLFTSEDGNTQQAEFGFA